MGTIKFNNLFDHDRLELLNVFDDIIAFIKEIKPILDKLNNQNNNTSLIDNKIHKVTEATEIACSETSFVLDGLFPKIDRIKESINQFAIRNDYMSKTLLNILLSIRKGIQANINLIEILPELNEVINILEKENNQNNILSDIEKELQSIKMDASSIMMTLYVQDISAQQLLDIKHFVDTIQKRVSKVLEKLEVYETENEIVDEEVLSENNDVFEFLRQSAFFSINEERKSNESNEKNDLDELINSITENDKTTGEIND